MHWYVPVWALISPQLIQMKLMGRMASMDNLKILIYIAVMAVPTYLIRMIPLTIIRKKIKNRFLLSFLFYMPYAVLGAMIFPAILYSTSSIYSAVIGFAAAIALSYMQKSLITVALLSSLAVFITEAVIM